MKDIIRASIIIAAYNEEKNLPKVIRALKTLPKSQLLEIIVVDDGSDDNTARIAKKLGVEKIVKHKKNKGKGASIKTGIRYATAEYIIQIDADNQFNPKEIPLILDPLTRGYDVVLGTRYERGSKVDKGSVEYMKLFGSIFLSFVTSIFAGQRVTDVMAGLKGFKRKAILSLDHNTTHFGYEAELVIKAAQKGYKIVNVPITYKRRIYGHSNVNSIKHGLLVLKTILKTGFSPFT